MGSERLRDLLRVTQLLGGQLEVRAEPDYACVLSQVAWMTCLASPLLSGSPGLEGLCLQKYFSCLPLELLI